MQRLKEIDQSGITRYTSDLPAFTRFDHSLGVYTLLRRYEAPMEECIAGLLHDASHTVFSHVGDFLFGDGDLKESYQDSIHLWYLKQQGIADILSPCGLTIEDIDPKRADFTALEQPLPDMCADRIEYNLHTAYLFGLMSQEDISTILNDLQYRQGKWFFYNRHSARRFADLSLHFTENFWGTAENLLSYIWGAEALRQAIVIGEISTEEMHFSTDQKVLEKLWASKDPIVQEYLEQCYHPLNYYAIVPKNEEELFISGKFRGIDPLVWEDGELARLTSLDAKFAAEYKRISDITSQGFSVKKQKLSKDLHLRHRE